MKRASLWGLTIGLLLAVVAPMTTLPAVEELESISGSGALAIHTGLPEFQKMGLDIANYRVSVARNADRVILLFTDVAATAGDRGSPPGLNPTISIELSSDSLHVLRSHINR